MTQRKKQRSSRRGKIDLFDDLPDDLVLCILSKVISSASCPADFVHILVTCKRLNRLGLHPLVLSRAGSRSLAIRAQKWSIFTHKFLKHCVRAGSVEACYVLGMIRFYCLQNRRSGASLMARASIKSHAPALYSLAVIQFNGSGGSKSDRNLWAGVALCARAAVLGHVNALRELGHCLQDGYGVPQNLAEGRRLLFQANARELASSIRALVLRRCFDPNALGCPGLPGCTGLVQEEEMHPVNRFLREWFDSHWSRLGDGLRLCSHDGCGRPETRAHEFRRCSVCGTVNYCSRGCQALDWKVRHKTECELAELWVAAAENHGGGHRGEVVEIENVAVG